MYDLVVDGTKCAGKWSELHGSDDSVTSEFRFGAELMSNEDVNIRSILKLESESEF